MWRQVSGGVHEPRVSPSRWEVDGHAVEPNLIGWFGGSSGWWSLQTMSLTVIFPSLPNNILTTWSVFHLFIIVIIEQPKLQDWHWQCEKFDSWECPTVVLPLTVLMYRRQSNEVYLEPSSISFYLQEAGRACRDDRPAVDKLYGVLRVASRWRHIWW